LHLPELRNGAGGKSGRPTWQEKTKARKARKTEPDVFPEEAFISALNDRVAFDLISTKRQRRSTIRWSTIDPMRASAANAGVIFLSAALRLERPT
jgi:hypothetical protein